MNDGMFQLQVSLPEWDDIIPTGNDIQPRQPAAASRWIARGLG